VHADGEISRAPALQGPKTRPHSGMNTQGNKAERQNGKRKSVKENQKGILRPTNGEGRPAHGDGKN
jgi:hypothetical protein